MPGLVKLRKENPGLEVIGWHVGKGTPAQIEKAVLDNKVDYPIVATPGHEAQDKWGVKKIPAASVVDKKGKVRYTALKPVEAEEKAVELLKE